MERTYIHKGDRQLTECIEIGTDIERKGKREAEVRPFCARGKIKSLSDAPVCDVANED